MLLSISLYAKACELVATSGIDGDLSSVVVRLGGFHLLMSFMGAVGYIMSGSGLDDIWGTVYAKASVVHMLTGHAYARALRAHFMTQLALAVVVLQELIEPIEDTTKVEISNLHSKILNNISSAERLNECPMIDNILGRMNAAMQYAAASSRTAKLWVQYFNQVQLMRLFIRAERTGDWQLHLHCVRQMLPHFHASAHLPYAKSAHLYLQQMMSLEHRMSPEEYD